MSLRELRQALEKTQARVAEALGIGQDGVSRLEQRSDLLISTLRDYVRAGGGDLELVERFPGRDPVILSGFAAMSARPVKASVNTWRLFAAYPGKTPSAPAFVGGEKIKQFRIGRSSTTRLACNGKAEKVRVTERCWRKPKASRGLFPGPYVRTVTRWHTIDELTRAGAKPR